MRRENTVSCRENDHHAGSHDEGIFSFLTNTLSQEKGKIERERWRESVEKDRVQLMSLHDKGSEENESGDERTGFDFIPFPLSLSLSLLLLYKSSQIHDHHETLSIL